ncbi:hypothetical protein [Serratia fonticola]|uniref:hypothetical protein n=1 Tax=Serratia fonticola TaxID=47917 RepID=UPI0016445F63|nr:hypothetical protein [Serratia fonticola]MBC3228685.1 hypothetical protein [Serratia fonticola]
MTDKLKKHDSVLQGFGIEYFQRCDYRGEFPEDYFNALKAGDVLYHLITDYESACTFSEIARLIGEFSVSASLCWVMHNQQCNAIHQLDEALYARLKGSQSLIASATSEYPDTGNMLSNENGRLRVVREAPVCSSRTHADYFAVSMKYKDQTSKERYLVLLPKASVAVVEGVHLSNNRSTCSGPIRIDTLIDPKQVIGKVSSVFASAFVPIAHIGWMSSYNGGLGGVLARVRSAARTPKSELRLKVTTELFSNRIAQAVALEYTNRCLIQDSLDKNYGATAHSRGASLNIIKTEVSRNIRHAASLLEDALGSKYVMTPFDPLGAEMFCRDARSASLMVHNDMFYREIFDLWLLKLI